MRAPSYEEDSKEASPLSRWLIGIICGLIGALFSTLLAYMIYRLAAGKSTYTGIGTVVGFSIFFLISAGFIQLSIRIIRNDKNRPLFSSLFIYFFAVVITALMGFVVYMEPTKIMYFVGSVIASYSMIRYARRKSMRAIASNHSLKADVPNGPRP